MLVQILSLLLVVFIVLLGALHMLCGSGMSLEGLCSHFPDIIGCTTLLNSRLIDPSVSALEWIVGKPKTS